MRRELNNDLFIVQDRQFLFDLGKMSMFRHAVGPDTFVAFGEKIIGFDFPSRASNAAQACDQNPFAIDGLPANQRPKRDEDAGGITTRTRDQLRLPNPFSINLWQSVNRLAE